MSLRIGCFLLVLFIAMLVPICFYSKAQTVTGRISSCNGFQAASVWNDQPGWLIHAGQKIVIVELRLSASSKSRKLLIKSDCNAFEYFQQRRVRKSQETVERNHAKWATGFHGK
ncbi:hypothetical protein [Pseudobacter ginsenosidimutans]|uniref:hypothetical protein n=1 Tax=Pseudobacter ginsenosidimutans TaxID=661488 RepID=UPI001CEF7A81|nr:hypothetical protein [Pseudobacter ginsenosidimutans]